MGVGAVTDRQTPLAHGAGVVVGVWPARVALKRRGHDATSGLHRGVETVSAGQHATQLGVEAVGGFVHHAFPHGDDIGDSGIPEVPSQTVGQVAGSLLADSECGQYQAPGVSARKGVGQLLGAYRMGHAASVIEVEPCAFQAKGVVVITPSTEEYDVVLVFHHIAERLEMAVW